LLLLALACVSLAAAARSWCGLPVVVVALLGRRQGARGVAAAARTLARG
jgi:hypothetical protein